LFRAVALADALEANGARVHIYANDDEATGRALRQRGRPWTAVPLHQSATSWEAERIRLDRIRVWVNDRLETSADHARKVLEAGARLATFDDSGSGAALAELHVSAIPLPGLNQPAGRRVLRGLQYLVMDPAIGRLRRQRHELGSIVVSMGGSDTYGLTVKVVQALRARDLRATVVVGPGFAHEAGLSEVLDSHYTVKRSVLSLPEEFALHDLAITAGGITPFEANAAGLPCIIVAAEPWEERNGRVLASLGGSVYAGPRGSADFSVLDSPLPVDRMSHAALAAVPADGAARVASELLAL
jgi:spore coat polysaccharide biosynthesis predicted glycosyltransferase SpsG